MTAFQVIRLVAARDFLERFRSKAFLLSTGFTLLLLVGFIVIPTFFDSDDATVYEVGVVGTPSPEFGPQLRLALGTVDADVELVEFASVAAGEQALLDEEAAALLAPNEVVLGPTSDDTLAAVLPAAVGALALVEEARELGLDDSQVTSILQSADVPVRAIEAASEAEESDRVFAFIATILLFISLITYGQWIALGVIEEKTNRVVEVVLGTITPRRLLAGKIIGIGALGLLQLALIAVIGLAAANAAQGVELPDAAAATVVSALVWFLLGFAMYAAAFAAAGSLVSRQEDAQNVVFPITIVMMAGYFIATTGLAGETALLRYASYVPLFAPLTMPLRIATGSAATWEVALSVGLMIVTTYFFVRLAARVYIGGVLRGASRVKLREAFQTAEV